MKIGSRRICHSPEFKKPVSGSLTPEPVFLTLLYVAFPSSLDEMTVGQEWGRGKGKRLKHTCINCWFTGSLVIKEREKFRTTPTFEQMETGGILFTDEKSRFESKRHWKVSTILHWKVSTILHQIWPKDILVEMSRKKKKTRHFRDQKISAG